MPALYIIGNGFDLFNGLKTSYSHFHRFVTGNYPDLENSIEGYFSFEADGHYLWKNFEHDLSTFDHESLFESLNDIDVLCDSFRPSEAFGLEDEIEQVVDELIDQIRSAFTEWVEQIEFPKKKRVKFQFQSRAKFINFNYTDTLELLYDVRKDDILYIHNKANDYHGELIFGHGLIEEPNPAPEELDEEGNSNRTLFSDAQASARYPFYALMKDTEEKIRERWNYLENLYGFSEVVVLGHSLGKVDWLYFKLFHELIPDAKWKISFYSDVEHDFLYSVALIEIGIASEKIEMILFEN